MFTQSKSNNPEDILKAKVVELVNAQRENRTHTICGGGASSYLGNLVLEKYLNEKGKKLIDDGRGYGRISARSITIFDDRVEITVHPRYTTPDCRGQFAIATLSREEFENFADQNVNLTKKMSP